MNTKKIKVFLTGSSGRIGTFVLKSLIDSGFNACAYDWKESKEKIPGVDYFVGDINNLEKLTEKMKGADAVVHLAAIPSPNWYPDVDLMQINVMGTFKVFEAASINGIQKVIQASSINALGAGYGKNMFKVKYLPIDEDHPCNISDSYSLSKNIVEQIAEYFWKKNSISSVSFRFPAVINLEQLRHYKNTSNQRIDITLAELEKMDEKERFRYFESLFANNYKGKSWEKLSKECNFDSLEEKDKLEIVKCHFSIRVLKDFLAYINIFDATRAVICALNAEISGAHPLFVNAPDIGKNCETSRIIRIFFPYVKEIRKNFSGNEPLIDTSRAEKIIGFRAKT